MKTLVFVLLGTMFLASCTKNETPVVKATVDDKIVLLKQYRAEKKDLQNKIYQKDQQIIALKCSVFSEVWAKDQWDLDCQDFFQNQQSKIKDAQAEIVEVEGALDPELDPEINP